MVSWFHSRRQERVKRPPTEQDGAALSQSLSEVQKTCEQALDGVFGLLGAFGADAFDVDDTQASSTQRRCEQWARHVVTGATHPDAPDRSSASTHRDGRPAARDWGGMLRFVRGHRQRERLFVGRMRDLFVQMASGIHHAFSADDAEDAQLRADVEELRIAAEKASLEQLRERVRATVASVERTLAERHERHRDELRDLGKRLSSVKAELSVTQHAAATDGLTRLYNRAAFDKHVERAAEWSSVTDSPISLLMLDIDHFKHINDEHGHRAGDGALRALADCVVRAASRSGDFVARYGGDELAIVLADTPGTGAELVGRRIVEAARRLRLDGPCGAARITVSVGAAERTDGESVPAWIDRADAALYRAKADGRDCVVVAGSSPPSFRQRGTGRPPPSSTLRPAGPEGP